MGRSNLRILFTETLFRADPREEAVGVDLRTVNRDITLLAIDEVSDPGVVLHVQY